MIDLQIDVADGSPDEFPVELPRLIRAAVTGTARATIRGGLCPQGVESLLRELLAYGPMRLRISILEDQA